VKVADKLIELLEPLHVDERPSDALVNEILEFSDNVKNTALDKGHYLGFPFRYEGWFRHFNARLEYDDVKYESQDSFQNQCRSCDAWLITRGDWRKCSACGVMRSEEDCEVTYNPPLDEEYNMSFAAVAPNPESAGKSVVAWVARQKPDDLEMMMNMAQEKMMSMTVAGMTSAMKAEPMMAVAE